MKSNHSFGNWLKVRRKALDLTQRDLADQVGCAVVTIRKFERDVARPSKQIADRLADALALSPDERVSFVAFARHPTESLAALPVDTAAPDPPANLPQFATAFVGRADEVEKIATALDDPYCRLLTLTGTGGVGKTRLAIQVAAQKRANFRQGVHFVPLAPLSSPEHIVPAIANSIGLLLRSDEFQRQQLLSYLGEKHLLLILDNVEHLLDGVSLITDILEAAPDVKLLVTSREALNLKEEWVRRIKGMEIPADGHAENLEDYGAIQLFVDRARRVDSDFSLTDEYGQVVCIGRLVEGLPLAIELAAAWLRTMTCTQIANAIQDDVNFLSTPFRNVPERHRSIRAVFERSWQLLTGTEQIVFRKLSVFRGGFTPDAGKQIAGALLPILTALTDKSLLNLTPDGRYDLHELLRQYSVEQLELAGEVDMIQRFHARYYAAFMQQLAASLKGRGLPTALKKIAADWDNVRAACRWLMAHRDFEQFDQLLECLYLYGLDYRVAEVQELWQQALDQFAPCPGEVPTPLWGRLLSRSADIFELRGPTAALASGLAHERAIQALEIARRDANMAEIGHSLCARGLLFRLQGNDHEALKCYNEALPYGQQYSQQSGDRFYLGALYHWIGFIQHSLGQLEESLGSFRQQLDLSREVGDSAGVAWALLRIGNLHLDMGHTHDAEHPIQESEMIHQTIGNTVGLSNCALFSAHLALLNGDLERARTRVDVALRIATDCGIPTERCGALVYTGVVRCLEGNIDQARRIFDEAAQIWTAGIGGSENWGLGLIHCETQNFEAAQKCTTALQQTGLERHRARTLTLSLPAQAIILAHRGSPERAVELLGLASVCPTGWTGWMAKWSLLTRIRAELESRLGAEVYQAAWERGKALDLETAIMQLLNEG